MNREEMREKAIGILMKKFPERFGRNLPPEYAKDGADNLCKFYDRHRVNLHLDSWNELVVNLIEALDDRFGVFIDLKRVMMAEKNTYDNINREALKERGGVFPGHISDNSGFVFNKVFPEYLRRVGILDDKH